ncbi:histidine phosphatase family protein [Sciscionella marina]|uniref:histidine phosphatase family protein n=1 Tax=Sciscionella marina TaxID=508770 RepID=UPI0003780633|nr:histidine phosphatase family protein [Sciscionella marina]
MTTFTFVRHGETVWHKENRYAGGTDVDLTELGESQAEKLAAWSASAGLDAIVVTDLRRSQLTAAPSVEATGLVPRVEPRLREISFGSGEGLTKAEMLERFPEDVRRFHAAPSTNPLPGGEPGARVIARALPAIRELVHEFPDGHLLVVGHSTTNRLLLCEFLGIAPDRYRELFPEMRNVARTTLRVSRDSIALIEFNAEV